MTSTQTQTSSEIPFQTAGDPVNLPSPVADLLMVVLVFSVPVIFFFKGKGKG